MPAPIWFLPFLLLSVATGVATSIYFWTNARLSHASARRAQEAARRGRTGKKALPSQVTAVVPVHLQEPKAFRACLASLREQGCAVLVVGDGVRAPYDAIADSYGASFLSLPVRSGKKHALSAGIARVRTPFVLLVDSDTVLPRGAVARLLSHFTPEVGGVGANLTVPAGGGPLAYCSEFVERSREVVHRAMSERGSVMLLDGACAMYRTSVVAPFVQSPEFLEVLVLGRRVPLGDDWLLTSFLVRSGWKVAKAYDVTVRTPSPTTIRGFLARNVRWARSSWIRLGRDLRDGTLKQGGAFFRWEVLGAYVLPLLTFATLISRVPLFLRRGPLGLFPPIVYALLTPGAAAAFSRHGLLLALNSLLWFAEMAALGAFLFAVLRGIRDHRGRTMAYGVAATAMLFVTTIYGLLTFWKGTEWEPRSARSPAPVSRPSPVRASLTAETPSEAPPSLG